MSSHVIGAYFREAAHVPHILLAVTGVDDAAGPKEEQRFKKRMRHQMPDSGGKRSDADTEEHVAELRNR